MTSTTRVAAIQMCSTPDQDANLDTAERLVRAAADQGAKLVVLPECFALLAPPMAKLAVAEPLPAGGPILARCQALAESCKVELVLGGFWETADRNDKVMNSSVMLGADGEVRAVYRKIHLFDVDLPDGTRLKESDTMVPGNEAVVTDSCAGKLGMTICYDVRYPELFRKLVDAGATLISVPAAFTMTTGKDHWHVLLRARAIECQAYVIAAAQTGNHFGDRMSYGHALICDPWGCVLSDAGDREGFAIADVDQDYVAHTREILPSVANRRL